MWVIKWNQFKLFISYSGKIWSDMSFARAGSWLLRSYESLFVRWAQSPPEIINLFVYVVWGFAVTWFVYYGPLHFNTYPDKELKTTAYSLLSYFIMLERPGLIFPLIKQVKYKPTDKPLLRLKSIVRLINYNKCIPCKTHVAILPI